MKSKLTVFKSAYDATRKMICIIVITVTSLAVVGLIWDLSIGLTVEELVAVAANAIVQSYIVLLESLSNSEI